MNVKVAGYSINQASLISLVTLIVGLVIAVVPSWAPEKELLIGVGTAVIVLGFLIANAIHVHAGAKLSSLSLTSLEPFAHSVVDEVKTIVKDVEGVATGKKPAATKSAAKAAPSSSAPAKATSPTTTTAAKS